MSTTTVQLSAPAPVGLVWPNRLANPRLNRCVTLAVLLHILLVLVFGSAPGGTARPGEGVWGSLNVSLIGPRTEPGSGPPSVPTVDAGAVGAAATQRFGGVVREENEAPRPNTPGAARQGNWNVRQGEKLIGEVAEPQPSMVQPHASVIATPDVPVAEILPPVPTEEPAPPPPPAPVLRTLKQAPTQEVQRQASPARPAAEPRAVSSALAPSLAEAEPVQPLAPLVLPAPAPVLRSLTAAPLPVATAEPDRQPQLSRLTPEPSAAALEPMQRLEQPVEAARPIPEAAPTPAATPAASPAAASAEPVRTVAPERGTATQAPPAAVAAPSLAPVVGAPDAGARLGRDVATAPSTPASAPRPALNLSLPRGGELSSQGTRGMLQLLPRPPDVKSRLSESIEKAAQADCRKAYSEQGLLAVVPLVRDAARDKGCRW
ncbi:MAG: hypothetical protein IV097_05365 [Burkholderiaceae bacterium]|nr:hypothetical protein [Burkholderiaceae bacterium]